MPGSGDVDVVIVTFGGADMLPGAVESVRAQGDIVGRILVIDNASPDGTADVASALDGVEVERLPANVGYAAAMNIGYGRTTAPYLLSLNADTHLTPGYLAALVAALDVDARAAAATGVLALADDVVDSTGIAMTTAYVAVERDRGATVAGGSTSAPFGVSGAAALWRRNALAGLGPSPWWEWLFVYWDDVELAWRLRRQGWHFAVTPAATARHRRGSDFAAPAFIEAAALRNRLATVARHDGWRGLLRPGPAAVTAVSMARLLVRRPRSMMSAHPIAAVRAGRRAAVDDVDLDGWDRRALVPHPWRAWLAQQLTGGRRGLGALSIRR